jgi:hypothetical protein
MNNQECVDPEAAIETCFVCGEKVHTCERTVAVNGYYRCPVHPNGLESNNGLWFCSENCHDDHFDKNVKMNDQN